MSPEDKTELDSLIFRAVTDLPFGPEDQARMETLQAKLYEIPNELVDKAYEAMTDELEFWRILGPDRNDTYIAVRDPEIQLKMKAHAIIMPSGADITSQAAMHYRMKDKAHAVACLQWHALKAALTAFKRELAPSASNTAAPTTADGQLNAAANDEEHQ